jgi:hypothetical protein
MALPAFYTPPKNDQELEKRKGLASMVKDMATADPQFKNLYSPEDLKAEKQDLVAMGAKIGVSRNQLTNLYNQYKAEAAKPLSTTPESGGTPKGTAGTTPPATPPATPPSPTDNRITDTGFTPSDRSGVSIEDGRGLRRIADIADTGSTPLTVGELTDRLGLNKPFGQNTSLSQPPRRLGGGGRDARRAQILQNIYQQDYNEFMREEKRRKALEDAYINPAGNTKPMGYTEEAK